MAYPSVLMPFGLLKYGFSKKHPAPRDFAAPSELNPHFDVIIIGGGGPGLATAYYPARDYGITNVEVIERGYIGGGNTGRNTAVMCDDLAKLVPELDLSDAVRYPILGALDHAPGAIARHDAVAWGYGGVASRKGVETDSAAAGYIWMCLLDAMAEWGGAAVGLTALRGLGS